MPKRTNDFQRLVKLVHQSLLPRNAKVTESAEVRVAGLEGYREIDVLIETDVGPFKMKIAMEAMDYSRRLNLPAVEKIIGKYRDAGKVMVDKVVIVAHRGFTRDALRKARLVGVEAMTLREAEKTDWKSKAISSDRGVVLPSVELLGVDPPIPYGLEEISRRGLIVCRCSKCQGQEKGTVSKMITGLGIQLISFNPEYRARALEQIRSSGRARISFEISPRESEIRIDGKDYSLQRIRARSSEFGEDAILPIPPPCDGALKLEMAPTLVGISVSPPPIDFKALPPQKIDVLCKAHENRLGCLKCYCRRLFENQVKSNPEFVRQSKEIMARNQGHVFADLKLTNLGVFLKANGKTHPVEEILLRIQCYSAHGAVHFTEYELIDEESQSCREIHCGEAHLGDKRVSIVMPDGMISRSIAVGISDSHQSLGDSHQGIDAKDGRDQPPTVGGSIPDIHEGPISAGP